MNFLANIPTPLQKLNDPMLSGVEVFIKRDDLIHPLISGNKWRKLKHNILRLKEEGKNTILSFGGAYSNHIHALAAAGSIFSFNTIGIIRGEETLPLNSTLRVALSHGMKLIYENRTSYRKKDSDEYLIQLKQKFGEVYILPEGGTNSLAVKGCAEIVEEINIDFDYICCPCGSGGTLAGLSASTKGKKVIGFSVLKGNTGLDKIVEQLLQDYTGCGQWIINHDYHFGGYAKIKPDLLEFMEQFEKTNGIQLEPIYTGKMMYGIYDLIRKGYFKKGERVIALHTGGMQGLNGFR